MLFDAREAVSRTVEFPFDATGRPLLTVQGVMDYIELDSGNLAAWFSANQTGLNLLNNTGFSVYFSDRRGNQTDPTAGSQRQDRIIRIQRLRESQRHG